MQRDKLCRYLDSLLEAPRFRDYCPNGLQVEGSAEIRRVICGVTASQALIDEAIRTGADTLLVHHGWFWKSDDPRVTGIRRKRMAAALRHDLNLIAYHLPLDAHPELGNNAQLAAQFGWQADGRFGEQDLGFIGTLAAPEPVDKVLSHIAGVLNRAPLAIGDTQREVRRVAWCTGGAQGYFDAAIAAGAELFLSGEASEQTTHLARESGAVYVAAGHHATERYGVQALGAHLAQAFGLDCRFVDIDNPV